MGPTWFRRLSSLQSSMMQGMEASKYYRRLKMILKIKETLIKDSVVIQRDICPKEGGRKLERAVRLPCQRMFDDF